MVNVALQWSHSGQWQELIRRIVVEMDGETADQILEWVDLRNDTETDQ